MDNGVMRNFETGATRSSAEGKPDFEGFLSPLAIGEYGQYMMENQVQADGKIRESDNWQKGMPPTTYQKGLWRHFWQAWMLWRGFKVYDWKTGKPVTLKHALCGVLFNVQGYLHELIKEELNETKP